MKTSSPRNAFVVKGLRGGIKFSSSVMVVKRLGIVDKLHRSSPKRLSQTIEHLETQKRLRVEREDGYVFARHLTPK